MQFFYFHNLAFDHLLHLEEKAKAQLFRVFSNLCPLDSLM